MRFDLFIYWPKKKQMLPNEQTNEQANEQKLADRKKTIYLTFGSLFIGTVKVNTLSRVFIFFP